MRQTGTANPEGDSQNIHQPPDGKHHRQGDNAPNHKLLALLSLGFFVGIDDEKFNKIAISFIKSFLSFSDNFTKSISIFCPFVKHFVILECLVGGYHRRRGK